MILGLCTKKELARKVNEAKVKSYQNGYEDAEETIDYLYEEIALKDEQIHELQKENRSLKKVIREERHEETRRIRAIAKRTKKYKVKKKCEARLDKIVLSKEGSKNDKK